MYAVKATRMTKAMHTARATGAPLHTIVRETPCAIAWSQVGRNTKETSMCTNGVNTGQLELMIEQIDDHCKLERRWAHNLAHTAGDAGFATVSEKLHEAQALLDDVRAKLDEAKDAIEDDAAAAPGVTVNLV